MQQTDPEIFATIEKELNRQRTKLELIASENIVSKAVMEAQGSVLTNKYAEGYPGKRYYGGCEFVDVAEQLAIDRAKKLFNCDYANVQPHSGAQANMAVFFALLNPGDTVMGMNLTDGGHLSHGSPVNMSGKYFKIVPYGVSKDTERIDYDALEKTAQECKPKLIVAGASAYARIIDFERLSKIAKSVGAYLLADIAHIAGLVATGFHPSPIPFADVVTTTTHKTLRGPRGAMILCKKEFADYVNKGCPMVLGGPLGHIMAAKAIAFKEARTPEYQAWARQVVKNAQSLAEGCKAHGMPLQTGGTDNHLMLVDVTGYGLTGKQAEAALFKCGVTANANALPYDKNGAWWTSGLRLGTPGLTTLGMNENDMKEVADIIDFVLKNTKPGLTKEGKPAKGKIEISDDAVAQARSRVNKLLGAHVLYPELDLAFLKKEFVKA